MLQYSIFAFNIFFSFRPFPLVKGGHSVSSFSTSFCLQHPSPSHQLSPYLPSLHLKIFSLVSLFSSFPVTPFPSFFFLHTHDMTCPYHLSLVSNLVFSRHSHSKPQHFHLCDFHLFYLFFCDCHCLKSIHHCWSYH